MSPCTIRGALAMLCNMAREIFSRTVLSHADVEQLSVRLARRMEDFAPNLVVYLERGGAVVGGCIGDQLGVPVVGIDVSYSLSRTLSRLPRVGEVVAWPIKEVSYRFGEPRLNRLPRDLSGAERIALVDDSASSGKSLKLALRSLEKLGFDRRRVCVGVIRCGSRARSIVDYFEIGRPVLFERRERDG